MGVKEILEGLKGKAASEITVAEGKLAEANAQVDTLRDLETAIESDNKAAHDAGFDEGLAQVAAPGEKVYSSEELEAELAPLKEDIEKLKGQLVDSETARTGLEGQITDLQAAGTKAVDEAVKAAKAAMVEKLKMVRKDDDALMAELVVQAPAPVETPVEEPVQP